MNFAKSILPSFKPEKVTKRKLAEKLMRENFDHIWFRSEYSIDETDPEALYSLYRKQVNERPVSPNQEFNESFYLHRYADVKAAVRSGQFPCGFAHYVVAGKEEGRACSGENYLAGSYEKVSTQLKVLFDEDWYLHEYPLAANEIEKKKVGAFEYYNSQGVLERHSPNSWFDEQWYLSFYPDVLDLIEIGHCRSGFDHYLNFGRAEHRIPRRKAKEILEYKFPGVTRLAGLETVGHLEAKLRPMPVEIVERAKLRINFVLPTLDKDIMFGGYAAILQLLRKTAKMGFDIRILVSEDGHLTEEYALFNLRGTVDKEFMDNVEFQNIAYRQQRIPVSKNDRFIAYSAWTALIASDLASCTDEEKIIFLIQEDERIFHHNDSIRALVESAYGLPHVPLFNSAELMRHFKNNGMSIFSSGESVEEPIWFNHVLTPVKTPTVSSLSKNNDGKRLLFYARPESHAARNLFEIGFLALKEAIRKGHFDRTWSFDGVGTLVEKKYVDIGEGRVMNMMPKLDGGAYGELLAGYDVGLSLMYAPHPGLVHFEMAAAGMNVVVNEYGERNAEYFANKSKNFLVAKPTISGLAEALGQAAARAGDVQYRVENALKQNNATSWDQVFTDEFMKRAYKEIGVAV